MTLFQGWLWIATLLILNLLFWGSGLLVALSLLVVFQGVLALMAWRSRTARKWRALLVENGRVLSRNLRALGLTRTEVTRAIRQAGVRSLEEVQSVLLETDGSLALCARREVPSRRSMFV